MADKNTPRGQWPKALVKQVFPDSEGMVRQVVVHSRPQSYAAFFFNLRLL